MTSEAQEVAANIKADLANILTLDHALAHLDKIGMTLAEVGMQVRANTAEALLNRANALRHRATRLVEREVYVCMSSLIATLASGYGLPTADPMAGLVNQAFELVGPVLDYESAAREAGWNWDEGGPHFYCSHAGASAFAPYEYDHEDRSGDWAALCNRHDIEPHELDVYEHWSVSTWLAEKLIERGERVDTDFAGLNVWARTNTGQAISADAAIFALAANLEA